MTGKKYLFVKVNQTIKNKVKFPYDNTLAAKGISDVSTKRKMMNIL